MTRITHVDEWMIHANRDDYRLPKPDGLIVCHVHSSPPLDGILLVRYEWQGGPIAAIHREFWKDFPPDLVTSQPVRTYNNRLIMGPFVMTVLGRDMIKDVYICRRDYTMENEWYLSQRTGNKK